MKVLLPSISCLALCCLLLPAIQQPHRDSFSPRLQPIEPEKGLFEADEVLQIKIAGNIREVFNDRGEKPQYHLLTLSYFAKDSTEISIPVKIKTRGHFRKDKAHCVYPPLLFNFSKKELPASCMFEGQDKLKLVMPCQGDEYVIREYLVYKLYNLLTPNSFRVRLVKVVMEDKGKKKPAFYGMLLENEEEMARRNNVIAIKRKMVNAQNAENDVFLNMAVFEYMIGNTDWSVPYLHNIQLLAKDSAGLPTTVPYDFDHCGLVNTPYAMPPEELGMQSVRERRYRGYCIPDMKKFEPVIALFNQLKKDFYTIYTSCSLLDARYIKTTTKYLDDFYATINNPKAMRWAFGYPCDHSGTGNIIIKGLGKD